MYFHSVKCVVDACFTEVVTDSSRLMTAVTCRWLTEFCLFFSGCHPCQWQGSTSAPASEAVCREADQRGSFPHGLWLSKHLYWQSYALTAECTHRLALVLPGTQGHEESLTGPGAQFTLDFIFGHRVNYGVICIQSRNSTNFIIRIIKFKWTSRISLVVQLLSIARNSTDGWRLE